jgi:DNA-binding transcriptional MocR family regulator
MLLRTDTKGGMMEWLPDLSAETGPMYLRIANAITAGVRSGSLTAGTALPPQRDLAFRLGVTVGTVTRAYQEAGRSGVLESDGRRGTRVRGANAAASFETSPHGRENFDLRGHASVLRDWGAQLRQTMMKIALDQSFEDAFAYDSGPGSRRYRTAGGKWLGHVSGHAGDPERMVVTNGAQHALFCTLLVLSKPGDIIATERLTYVGLKSCAAQLGLQFSPLEIDQDGLVPDSFENACIDKRVRVLVTVPDNHNPTTVTQPIERRKKIAEIAARHGVTIVEDTVYSGLSGQQITPYAAIYSAATFRLTGFSKTLGPGLRTGFVEAPASMIGGLVGAIRATAWMASPLQSEAAVRLIEDGTAEEILQRNTSEFALRNESLRKILGECGLSRTSTSPHTWLRLPEPWTKEQFQIWAIENNVLILGSEAFSVVRGSTDNAVRISVSAPATIPDLERAAHLIAVALRTRAPDVGAHA